jgi:regulation of enolase protein 1 (concanavalin A-like superfamily)
MDPLTGAITIGSCAGDLWWQTDTGHYVWQPVKGDFLLEAKVDLHEDPLRGDAKVLLAIRDSMVSNQSLMFTAVQMIRDNASTLNVLQRVVPGAGIVDSDPWVSGVGNPCYLRVKRKGGVLFAEYREDTLSPWTLIHSYDDSGGPAFARELYVCLGVTAPVQNSPKMLQTATFSDISLRRLDTGTVIMVR